MNQHDPLLDHRARIERNLLEAAERRTQAISDQRSPDNSHDKRVRAWERLHQVSLPRDPGHNVLRIVARQTGLALADVHEVQRQRAQPPAV
jgi:hypothetical protein